MCIFPSFAMVQEQWQAIYSNNTLSYSPEQLLLVADSVWLGQREL